MGAIQKTTVVLLVIVGIFIVVTIALIIALTTEKCSISSSDEMKSGNLNDTVENPPTTAITRTTHVYDPSKPWLDYLLPKHVIPMNYNVTLHPNLTEGTFQGSVDITVMTTKPIDYFLVNVKFLNVTKALVKRVPSNDAVLLRKHFEYPENEFYVLECARTVAEGRYMIQLEFKGSLVNGIMGFYRSTYVDSNTGTTRYLATSKFQPTYARRAFPCFDEPSFKSTFQVNLIHEKEYTALSNMDVESIKDILDNTLKLTSFRKSVEMVTYLVCFIVSEFKFTSTVTANGKPFRVYARPDQVNLTNFATDLGSKIQDFYATYFDIPYPLPKQDMIAIPDFPSGAMEHWGLITFREVYLLVDPTETSSAQKQRTASVIAHELTHQWFGNLMTMEWWDDLWLNEGFASFFEYKGMDQFHPDWEMNSQVLLLDVQGVMDRDSTLTSHPIIQLVKHPDEITELFDSISYYKASSVIRMLENFIGKAQFQTGLQNFLKKYAFKNARTDHLWTILSETVNDINVTKIMDTWTRQMGFPVITVTRNDDNTITAEQERFLKNKKASGDQYGIGQESPFGYLWEIPFTYITSKDSNEKILWIKGERKVTFSIPNTDLNDWIKFNHDQMGFYRVNYGLKEWGQFSQLLLTNHQAISIEDRSNLLDDVFSLAEGSRIPYHVALELASYLRNERSYVPWATAIASLSQYKTLLDETEVYPKYRDYLLNLTTPVFEELGWEDTGTHVEKLLRLRVLALMCNLGHKRCLQLAATKLEEWKTTKRPIPPNIRRLVYYYGVGQGGADMWDHLWSEYLATSSAQESNNILQGLANAKETWLLHRLLRFGMDETKVRRQDFFQLVLYISGNSIGRPIVWSFIRNKWEELVARFTLNDRNLGALVFGITSSYTTKIQLEEMDAFFKKYPEAGAGSRARLQAYETVQGNIDWLERNEKQFADWLQTALP